MITAFKRLAFVCAALLAGFQLAQAQTPVTRIIVPFAPGGGQDVLARVIAPELATLLGETIIIEIAQAQAAPWARRLWRGQSPMEPRF